MIKIVYITEKGKNLAKKIENILKYYKYPSSTYHLKDFQIEGKEKGFIFIMAVGIVIRRYIEAIKEDKTKDPFL